MISKVRTGVEFFDQHYGGAYRGRSMLVTGRSGSGKSLFGLQFITQGVREEERCLLLSVRPAADVVLYAEAFGLPIANAVDDGSVIALEYNDYVPGMNSESELSLPPEGFMQLQEIIESNGVRRIVLDTCLPWMTTTSSDSLGRHVFSFIRSFDRLDATTVLTLPKPVSPVAFKLKSVIEDIVPVAVTLAYDEAAARRTWIVNKYLGAARLDSGVDMAISSGIGLHADASVSDVPEETLKSADPSPIASPAPPLPADTTPVPTPARQPSRVRFANVILGNAETQGDRR